MQRRDFLRLASSAGVVIAPWALIPEAQAQSYMGRILVNIHADGGLDQSSWTDPRESDRTINNYAAAGTPAGVAGNIRFAPMGNNAAFFAAHSRNMLVTISTPCSGLMSCISTTARPWVRSSTRSM